MGEEYGRELERVRQARASFEASQDEVDRRKQEYFVAVRTLHETGMPLREIATALGLSHQRVHQMVEEATGKRDTALRRKLARAAKQGGVALLLILVAGTGAVTLPGLLTSNEPDQVAMEPSPSGSEAEAHAKLRDTIELDCAQRMFEWNEVTQEAFGKSATVVMEPMCEIATLAPVDSGTDNSRSQKLEMEVQRRLRAIMITIREQARA